MVLASYMLAIRGFGRAGEGDPFKAYVDILSQSFNRRQARAARGPENDGKPIVLLFQSRRAPVGLTANT
jgi:hypothetical protein